MKSLIKYAVLLIMTTVIAFGQVVISEPDAPSAFTWGGDLSEQQEKEYLAKIKNEQLKKELQQIKQINEKKYYSLLRKTSFMGLPSVYSLSGSNVSFFNDKDDESKLRNEIAELELYSEVLGVKYQNADGSDKQKLAVQLKETLNDVFELRESQRKEEIKELEEKLAELKESIKIRTDNKEQIVNERFRTLTGKGKYLRWD